MEKIDILKKHLGNFHIGHNNYIFKCPFCNHHKKKLEISIEKNLFHCWVCNESGSIYKLVKKLNISYDETKYFFNRNNNNTTYYNKNKEQKPIELPKEFKSLININNKDFIANSALNYLKKRNINSIYIKRYNIGYCPNGDYEYKIIIPSYDEFNNLNYFISRSFNNNFIKYKNPDIERNDIIIFEKYINFNYPITLVEGVFDAITANYNTIPLLGKNLSEKLKYKLELSNTKEIYLCLDNDAIESSLEIIEYLQSIDKEVYFIDAIKHNFKDINELGHEKYINYLLNSKPLSFKDKLKLKLYA